MKISILLSGLFLCSLAVYGQKTINHKVNNLPPKTEWVKGTIILRDGEQVEGKDIKLSKNSIQISDNTGKTEYVYLLDEVKALQVPHGSMAGSGLLLGGVAGLAITVSIIAEEHKNLDLGEESSFKNPGKTILIGTAIGTVIGLITGASIPNEKTYTFDDYSLAKSHRIKLDLFSSPGYTGIGLRINLDKN